MGEGKNKRQKWTEEGQLEARWWGDNPPLTRREQAEDRTLAALRVVAIRLADVSWEGGRVCETPVNRHGHIHWGVNFKMRVLMRMRARKIGLRTSIWVTC